MNYRRRVHVVSSVTGSPALYEQQTFLNHLSVITDIPQHERFGLAHVLSYLTKSRKMDYL
jgi:hypothetical protein